MIIGQFWILNLINCLKETYLVLIFIPLSCRSVLKRIFQTALKKTQTPAHFHIVLTFIGPALLYSIVWNEKFISDLRYRTLMNQLLSHICIITIFDCLIGRMFYISSTIIGPFSVLTCGVIMSIGRFFFACRIMELIILEFIKFLYIFQWKYLASLNDDFFCNLFYSL